MPKDYKTLVRSGILRLIKTLVRSGILGLIKTPPEGDIKQLQGSKGGQNRLRIGRYRILFQYLADANGQYLYINTVGSRGDICK